MYLLATASYLGKSERIAAFQRMLSRLRYEITNEPRTIFRTVAYIAQDVLRNNPKASFLFIGAADKRDKPGHTTRRFRVYVEFLHQLDLYDLFLPVEITNLSMLVLVNKDSVSNVDAYINQIIEFIG